MAQLPASGPQQREAEMPAGGRRRDRDHKGRGRGRDGPPGAARAATAGTLVAVTPESEGGTRRPAASAAWVAAAVAAAMAATSRTVPPMSAAGTKAPAAATAAVTAAAAAAATVGKAAAAAGAALTVDESSWASATCRATAAVRRQCAADSLSQKRPQAALCPTAKIPRFSAVFLSRPGAPSGVALDRWFDLTMTFQGRCADCSVCLMYSFLR